MYQSNLSIKVLILFLGQGFRRVEENTIYNTSRFLFKPLRPTAWVKLFFNIKPQVEDLISWEWVVNLCSRGSLIPLTINIQVCSNKSLNDNEELTISTWATDHFQFKTHSEIVTSLHTQRVPYTSQSHPSIKLRSDVTKGCWFHLLKLKNVGSTNGSSSRNKLWKRMMREHATTVTPKRWLIECKGYRRPSSSCPTLFCTPVPFSSGVWFKQVES